MNEYPNSSFELFIHKFPAETPKPLRQKDYLSRLAEPVPPKTAWKTTLVDGLKRFEASSTDGKPLWADLCVHPSLFKGC